MTLSELYKAVKALAPIKSVSKSGVVIYEEGATVEQITAVNSYLATVTLSDIPTPTPVVYINKLTIVKRLEELSKKADVKAALSSNTDLQDWYDNSVKIAVNDANVMTLLESLGIDASQVLYPE